MLHGKDLLPVWIVSVREKNLISTASSSKRQLYLLSLMTCVINTNDSKIIWPLHWKVIKKSLGNQWCDRRTMEDGANEPVSNTMTRHNEDCTHRSTHPPVYAWSQQLTIHYVKIQPQCWGEWEKTLDLSLYCHPHQKLMRNHPPSEFNNNLLSSFLCNLADKLTDKHHFVLHQRVRNLLHFIWL